MKCISLLLTFVFCLPVTAHADDASRHAKAQEMLSLLHMDKMMDQMTDSIMGQMSAATKQMGASSLTPQQQARTDEFQKKMFQLILDQLGWKAMEPEYVDLYAKTFSDEDLDGIIAFYKSPAGVSMVEKLPALTTQAMNMAQTKMVALQPQLQQMIADFARSSAAAAPPASGASTPK